MNKRTARAVDRLLAQRYGSREWPGRSDPVDGLVATILSQNTTGTNSRAAFAKLKERFPTWEQAADARASQIEAAIQSGGLAAQKSVCIRKILRDIRDSQGGVNLDILGDMPTREALKYLVAFKGVGPKTAACVLMFDLGRDVFPVDTHVHRICTRLGWIPEGASAERAFDLLEAALPGDVKYQLHINMVHHGRALCRPTSPRCDACPITRHCQFL